MCVWEVAVRLAYTGIPYLTTLHMDLLPLIIRFCLEMSSDFKYYFGFVFEPIFEFWACFLLPSIYYYVFKKICPVRVTTNLPRTKVGQFVNCKTKSRVIIA